MIRFAPANPSTSIHPARVDFASGCQRSRNCDVRHGIWKLGERYRAWQPAPERTYTIPDDDPPIEVATNWQDAEAISEEVRTGWNIAWTNGSYASDVDGAFADAPFTDEDQKTKQLRAYFAFDIPAAATVSKVKVRVLRKVSATGGAVVRAADDLVQGDADSTGTTLSDNVAELDPVGTDLEWKEYELTGALPDATELASGTFSVLCGWIGGTAKDVYEVADVTADVDPEFVEDIVHVQPNAQSELEREFVVSVSHSGDLHPDAVRVQVYSKAEAQAIGPSLPEDPTFVSTNANNGLGTTNSNTGEGNSYSLAESTVEISVPLDETGAGTYSFTGSANAYAMELPSSASTELAASVSVASSGGVIQSATLSVEAIQCMVEYEIDGSGGEVEVNLTGAQGIAYSDHDSEDVLSAVWGQGIFDVDGIYSKTSVGTIDHWTLELSDRLLAQGAWACWVHEGKIFYAHPTGGVLYQAVGSRTIQELYQDTQSPGSTGDATYRQEAPDYVDQAEMDSALDTVNGTHSVKPPGTSLAIGTGSGTGDIDSDEVDSSSDLATVKLSWGSGRRDGWVQIEMIYNSARDFSGSSVLGYTIEHRKTDSDAWGHLENTFLALPTLQQVELEDADGSVWRYTPQVALSGNRLYGWVDLADGTQITAGSTVGLDLENVKEVRIRFGATARDRGQYRVKSLVQGGTFYQNLTVEPENAAPSNMLNSIYAYRFYEIGQPARAKKISVPDTVWLGSKNTNALPYLFSWMQIMVPRGDAPYSASATIELYRYVDTDWRLVAIGSNESDLVFTDQLPDSVVDPDLTTYPTAIRDEFHRLSITATGGTYTLTYDGQTTANIAYNASAATVQGALEALSNLGVGDITVTADGSDLLLRFTGTLAQTNVEDPTLDPASLTGGSATLEKMYDGCGDPLNFDALQPIESGAVLGIVFGLSWKGSNVYLGNDGKAYFSKANAFDEVLWDDVVLTNDVGSEDLGPARTAVIPDNISDPLVCGVAAENLYIATPTEIYVMVSGETAATASFPRKIDGARGCVGKRACTAYADTALFGARDGLWQIKKTSDYGEQPDLLAELTKGIRGDWEWLLGDAEESLVVRTYFGDIWCFCESRYIQFTRHGSIVVGTWADAAEVHDACASKHGLLVQLEDGRLGIVGEYFTDGGNDLLGEEGTAPAWTYRGGRRVSFDTPVRVGAYVHGPGTTSRSVSVKAITFGGDETLQFSESSGLYDKPFPRQTGGFELGAGYTEIELSGGAKDEVHMLEVEMNERSNRRSA